MVLFFVATVDRSFSATRICNWIVGLSLYTCTSAILDYCDTKANRTIFSFFSQTSIQAIRSLQWNIVKYLADGLIQYKWRLL